MTDNDLQSAQIAPQAATGVTIADLPAAQAADDADSFEIQSSSGGSKKLTFAQIRAAIGQAGTCTCQAITNSEIDTIF